MAGKAAPLIFHQQRRLSWQERPHWQPAALSGQKCKFSQKVLTDACAIIQMYQFQLNLIKYVIPEVLTSAGGEGRLPGGVLLAAPSTAAAPFSLGRTRPLKVRWKLSINRIYI